MYDGRTHPFGCVSIRGGGETAGSRYAADASERKLP